MFFYFDYLFIADKEIIENCMNFDQLLRFLLLQNGQLLLKKKKSLERELTEFKIKFSNRQF